MCLNVSFQGFNTYYNNSVLTYVLMPEAISISLGFKFFNSAKVLREALIGRFGEHDEVIHPGPRGYDGRYTEMTLSCSDHVIRVQSSAVDDKQYVLITPLEASVRPPVLLISAAVLWNRPGYAELNNGRLLVNTPGRHMEIFTDGKQVRQMNTGLTNPYIAVELSGPVAVSTDKTITAAELAGIMDSQKEIILAECAKYGELSEAYNAMRTCLAWDTIYEPEKEQICSPVSRLWSLGWGGYVLFDWDTYFSSIMASIDNKELAYANAIAITHEKTEAGFIPNFGAADDNKSRDRSQPPVGSLAVREIYRVYREEWLVRYLFDELLTWNRWFAAHRMLPNGQLCWGSDPFDIRNGGHWEREGVNKLLGAALESGLDNSPMYDDMPFDTETHMMGLADVGLTGLYIMDCEALAELADVINRPEAGELRERASVSKNGLEEMWDEEFGLYLNKRVDNGQLSRRISPTNFYALFSDRVAPERVQRMVKEHFFNEREFYGEFIMPSIARDDPAYPDQNYWRGRIWAPMNYLAYIALRKHHGQNDAAEACKVLAEKSKNLLLKEWNMYGHVHENYDGDNGMGCGVRSSDKFYHWGALLALIALIESEFVHGPEQAL